MTYQGIDTAARITAVKARILRSDGFSFVARYLVPEAMWKALTAQEAADIRAAGLALMLCWEIGGDDIKQGAPNGAEHGRTARQLAEGLGVPAGTCIYFAADYNVPEKDYTAVEQYMIAAQTALGGKYVAGLYGPLGIVDFLAKRGSIKRFWQCVAWSNSFSPAATVRQYAHQGDARAKAVAARIGVDVDLNACETLTGMWGIPVPGYDDSEGGTIIDYTGGTQSADTELADAVTWARGAGIVRDGEQCDGETVRLLWRYFKTYRPEDPKWIGGAVSD